MLGTIVNVCTIVLGSLIGGLFKKIISEKVCNALMDAMGMAAFVLGINAICRNMPNSTYPVLFIASIALGGVVGTVIDIDKRVNNLTEKTKKGNATLSQGIITGCLLYCIGTLSILGPVNAALNQDYTFLFTNASLDLVTSMVLGTTYGPGMALAAVVLFLWQGSIYGLTMLSGGFVTDTMMTELSVVGGILIAMSGISIMKIKSFKTLNYLPALVFPIIWCLIRG